jgi:hypothetical protein
MLWSPTAPSKENPVTTSTSSPPAVSTESSLSTVTAVGTVFAALGSIGYIAPHLVDDDIVPRDAFASPLGIGACLVATVGALLMGLSLVRWRVALPGWAVLGAATGLVFVAANTWFFGTGIVAVADHTDDALFETIGTSGWIWAMYFPKMLLCLVSFVALGVAGWRRRSIPRPAAAVLALAGVLSLVPPHPPGLVLASLAFFLIARSGMTARQ